MVDVSSISIVIAATSVVIAAISTTIQSRKAEKMRKTDVETRQIGVYMQFAGFSQTKEFMKALNDVLYTQEWKDYDDWMKKYGPVTNPEYNAYFGMVCSYFDNIGMLISKGILDINIPFQQAAGTIIGTWERVEPIVKQWREEDPSAFRFFEYLYSELKKKRETRPLNVKRGYIKKGGKR